MLPDDQSTTDARIERKRFGFQTRDSEIDFRTLTARNQLISRVLNPLLDALVKQAKHEHSVDSGTRYGLKIILVSERELDPLN